MYPRTYNTIRQIKREKVSVFTTSPTMNCFKMTLFSNIISLKERGVLRVPINSEKSVT